MDLKKKKKNHRRTGEGCLWFLSSTRCLLLGKACAPHSCWWIICGAVTAEPLWWSCMAPCSVISCNENGRLCQIKSRVLLSHVTERQGCLWRKATRTQIHLGFVFSWKRNVSKASVATSIWEACMWPAFSEHCSGRDICLSVCASHWLKLPFTPISPPQNYHESWPKLWMICSVCGVRLWWGSPQLLSTVYGQGQWAGERTERHRLFLPSLLGAITLGLFLQTHSFLHSMFIVWGFSIGVLTWCESWFDCMGLVCGCVRKPEDNLLWCSSGIIHLVFWEGPLIGLELSNYIKDPVASISPALRLQMQATTPAGLVLFVSVSVSVLFLTWVLGSSSGPPVCQVHGEYWPTEQSP